MIVTWNQKYLDYEIETGIYVSCVENISLYLKSEVSRLRDWNNHGADSLVLRHVVLKSEVSRLRDWNMVKNLKQQHLTYLEIRSISITRLKRRFRLFWGFIKYWTWNQKYLDYEIET